MPRVNCKIKEKEQQTTKQNHHPSAYQTSPFENTHRPTQEEKHKANICRVICFLTLLGHAGNHVCFSYKRNLCRESCLFFIQEKSMQGTMFVSHTKTIQRALLASARGVFSSFHYALVAFLLR